MERKDFIEKVGLSAASILIFGCMQSCSKSDGPAPLNQLGLRILTQLVKLILPSILQTILILV